MTDISAQVLDDSDVPQYTTESKQLGGSGLQIAIEPDLEVQIA